MARCHEGARRVQAAVRGSGWWGRRYGDGRGAQAFLSSIRPALGGPRALRRSRAKSKWRASVACTFAGERQFEGARVLSMASPCRTERAGRERSSTRPTARSVDRLRGRSAGAADQHSGGRSTHVPFAGRLSTTSARTCPTHGRSSIRLQRQRPASRKRHQVSALARRGHLRLLPQQGELRPHQKRVRLLPPITMAVCSPSRPCASSPASRVAGAIRPGRRSFAVAMQANRCSCSARAACERRSCRATAATLRCTWPHPPRPPGRST